MFFELEVMKNKLILKFYFGADKLNEGLDRLIMSYAFGALECERAAAKIEKVIEFKAKLCEFYDYLDGIFSGLAERDRRTLEAYAASKEKFLSIDESRRREIKRCLVKFYRHARRIENFLPLIEVVGKYYSKVYL